MSYEHRKSAGSIRFIGKDGRAVSNREIHYELKNHEFLFGCGAFDALPAAAGADIATLARTENIKENDPKFYRERLEKWRELFNFGTLPFYWGRFEPTEGDPKTESRIKAAQYMKDRGVTLKGHPLCWHTVCADWLMQYDNETILDKQLARITREVSTFKGLIDMWDVINEVVIMPVFDRYDNAVTRICKDLGRVRLVKEVFEAAKAANPDAVLLINDFNLSESYRILIDGCLAAGVPISAIGIQTHQHQGYMGKEKLEDILERYSVFGVPLHFTENSLVSGALMPPEIVDLNDYQVEKWPSTEEGEERQRQEWTEMMELLFEHPSVEALTWWGFSDGGWLNAPSGLIREDGTKKPAFYAGKELIHEKWHSEGTVRTDANGIAVIEGFRGEYEVKSAGLCGSLKLTKKSQTETAEIVLA